MYQCDDCGNRFETPVFGSKSDGLVLGGCPECGCVQYTEMKDKVEVVARDRSEKMDSEERLAKLLVLVEDRRGDVLNFIQYLDGKGFREAPASSKYHLNYEGGLLEHSLNVAENLLAINRIEPFCKAGYLNESICIVGLFHDVCKVTDAFGRCYYQVKYNKDGKRSGVPFERNKEIMSSSGAFKSVLIVSQFVPLYEDEVNAISFHDGLYVPEGKCMGLDMSPLTLMLHFADMYAGIMQELSNSRLHTISRRNKEYLCGKGM